MRIEILAIGRLKDDAEASIIERYQKRFDQIGRSCGLGPLTIADFVESRAATADERKSEEAVRLLKAASTASLIVLEPSGKALSSEAFAAHLRAAADIGHKSCAFLIGGPDGHGTQVIAAASLKLSLGLLTLPHGLARVVLTEQLYRAATILTRRPYHRA